MRVSRRGFLKYCVGSTAALGMPLSVIGKLEGALAEDGALPTVIWLNGANCTGVPYRAQICSVITVPQILRIF